MRRAPEQAVVRPVSDQANDQRSIQRSPSALFDPLVGGYRVNTSIFITLVVVAAAWVFIQWSFAGYRMTVGGAAPAAARFAGFRESRAIWLGLLIGGGCAGLAGMMEAAGPLGQLSPTISPGYGFAAIIVAFIGRLHPFGIVLGGLLLSLLYMGGESAQIMLKLPAALNPHVPGHAALLPAGGRLHDLLPAPPRGRR